MNEHPVTYKNLSKTNLVLFFNKIILLNSNNLLHTQVKQVARKLQKTFYTHKYSSNEKTGYTFCFPCVSIYRYTGLFLFI